MPTRSSPHPTEAELEILQVLWNRGPSTVRDVHEVVNEPRGASYTTTLKMLQIMLEKGLVKRDDSERSHRFTAVAKLDATRRSMVKTFMDRVFGGSPHDLLLAALGNGEFKPDELEKIRALVESKKRKGGK